MTRTDTHTMREYRQNLYALRPAPRWIGWTLIAVWLAGSWWLANLTLDALEPVSLCYDAQDDAEIPPCAPGTIDPLTGHMRR